MFAVETETAFSVNRRSLTDFQSVEDPVVTVAPVTTTSETSAVYDFSAYQAFTSSNTTAQYGVICNNNPVNFTDPFGLAPGDPYPSPKAAGIQAGKDFGGVFQWLERAGLIYQKGNDFSYTAPAPLNTSTHLSSRPGAAQSQVPESAKIIGAWHTHPILSEPYLSPDDFVAANKFHKLGANFNVMTPAIGSPTVYGFDSEGKFFNKKASDPSAPCGK